MYGIADKENRLGGSLPDVAVTGTDIKVKKPAAFLLATGFSLVKLKYFK